MNGETRGLIQVGVVGLGPRWRKYLCPALVADAERFRLVMVADTSRRRADEEGARLRCPSAASVGRLVRHPEVDAVLLADATWQGLWALEEAVALGKPVVSALPLGVEADRLAEVEAALKKAERTVQFLHIGINEEVAASLRGRLGELGTVKRVLAECSSSGWLGLVELADLVMDLVMASATQAQALGEKDESPHGLYLDSAEGLMQFWLAGCARSRVRFECAHGHLVFSPPRTIRWRCDGKAVRERLPLRSTLGQQLANFYERVWAGEQDEAGLERAGFHARILAAAARSLADGGRSVDLGEGPGDVPPGPGSQS